MMPSWTPTSTVMTPVVLCDNIWIDIDSFWQDSSDPPGIGVYIVNDNPVPVWIQGVRVHWDFSNGRLLQVKLGDSVLWNGLANPPDSFWITVFSENEEIPPHGTKPLLSYFEILNSFGGYLLEVYINGCYESGGP